MEGQLSLKSLLERMELIEGQTPPLNSRLPAIFTALCIIFTSIVIFIRPSEKNVTKVLGYVRIAVAFPSLLALAGGVVVLANVFNGLFKWWKPKLARKLNSNITQKLFIQGITCIMTTTTIYLTGDLPTSKTQAMIICNHQLDVDWFYLFEMLRVMGRHGDLKVLMKDDFEKIPIIASGAKGLQFLTLRRDWTKDKERLNRQLKVFIDDKAPLKLLIFPEGTTQNLTSQEKCLKFAKEQGRPDMKYVLLPRSTGFQACVEALVRDAPDGMVYDVTMGYEGYSGEIPSWDDGYDRKIDKTLPNMRKLMMGFGARPVHMDVKKYSLQEVVKTGAEKWLDDAWVEKDKLMAYFIKEGKFPGDQKSYSTKPAIWSFMLMTSLPWMVVFSSAWVIYHYYTMVRTSLLT